MKLRENEGKNDFLFLPLFWTPCAWGRAADCPLTGRRLAQSTGLSWQCHPAFLSRSTGSTGSGRPRAAGGLQRHSIPWSWGKEVASEVRFLTDSPWSLGNWSCSVSEPCRQMKLGLAGWSWASREVKPGKERKESRQIEITRCPCLPVI